LATPLDEGTLDMMLGNKSANSLRDVGRHRDGLNNIAAGIGERLPFARIGRDGKYLVRRLRRDGTQGNP
jgi:hypothetical protein